MTRKGCCACCAWRASAARDLRRAGQGERPVMRRRCQPGRLVHRQPQPGQGARDRRAARSVWASSPSRRASSACPSPRRPATTFVDNAELKARLAARPPRPARPRRRFSGLVRRRARRRAGHLFRALGGRRARTSPSPWSGCTRRCWRGPGGGRDAHFVCALCASPGPTAIWRASKAGSTARSSGRRAATHGFGYDPMFLPIGHRRTFGEMDPRRQARRSATAPTPSASWWRHCCDQGPSCPFPVIPAQAGISLP